MIISERQIMQLISLLHEARKTISIARIGMPDFGMEFSDNSANILNEINNQQSSELQEVK